jgi:tetratricopeptide (TPR) repeat protein
MRVPFAVILLLASPVMARESPEWTYCDFGIDPKAGLFGTNRWLENGKQTGIADNLYRNPGLNFVYLPKPQMEPEAACAAALASPDLEAKDWARRVSLYEARAAHRIAAGQFEAALGDLDAARAAFPPNLDAAERARSLDIGLMFLRALALNGLGKSAEAVSLVTEAAAARPWSGQVQDYAASLLRSIPGGSAALAPIAERQFRLDATMRENRARSRQAAGDFAGAVADWQLVKPAVTEATTVYVPLPGVRIVNAPGWAVSAIDPARVGTAALAAAFAGDAATARRWLQEARAAAAAAPEPVSKTMAGAPTLQLPTVDKAKQDESFAHWTGLVEAAIAWQQGRKAEARTAVEQIGTIGDEAAEQQALSLIMGTPPAAPSPKGRIDARRLFARLPSYEGGDMVPVANSESPGSSFLFGARPATKKPNRNSYSGSAGFFKAAGFKSKPMKNGPGTTVTFTGDASSIFSVEEMTLLRAAELAREAGKPQLLILDKRDFARSSQFTVNGSPAGGATPAGFMTELDVVFTDTQDERAIPVADIIAGLGPVYLPR